ncbi:hypothetical protein LPJ64_004281 [Coemansia asiatica]|uniref:Ubiquitin-like domain-containing protein n=1 Tax=Coemansia asiatica TaxID=1052880 RepID=A0A9W7XGE4_9FUNG|nr:hypothetical protein LPJ64_004281 [Coemansia asiatica]
MKVSLLVRSSSVPTEENFRVVLNGELTVRELKQMIEKEHPAAPRARGMRVIWRGRLLKDTEKLSSLYVEEEPDAEQPETIHSVVHFVVADVVAKMASMASSSKSQGKKKENEGAHVELGRHAGGVGVGRSQEAPRLLPTPSVIPLGSMFQYVLIDGVPYVAERSAQSAYGLMRSGRQGASAGGLDMHEFNARMLAQRREAERQQQQQQQSGHVPADGQMDQNAQPLHPLADVFRNLTFGNIWSVIWVLLRLLLFVVVFAHDASWERMFLLSMLVAGFLILRSQWVQQQLALLRQYDRRMGAAGRNADANANANANADADAAGGYGGPQMVDQQGVNGDWHPEREQQVWQEQDQDQEQQRREFSALEKARALVIALFTSLIPAEPFHVPAPADD